MRFRLLVFLCALCVANAVEKEDSECNLSSLRLQTDSHPEFSETAENIQAQWVDKDQILVLASDSPSGTTVWQGSMQATGLYRFKKQDQSIEDPVNPLSLRVAENSLKTTMVVSEDKTNMYISQDGGITWVKHKLPASDFNPLKDITFSSESPSRMKLFTLSGRLYISIDFGSSWEKVAEKAKQASFAIGPRTHQEFLFYSVASDHPFLNPLHRMDLLSFKTEVVDSKSFRFYADSNYLFVSRQNFTSQTQYDQATRRFYVSTDFDADGTVTFKQMQLPAAHWQDYVSVITTHEAGAFIHISTKDDSHKGTLYASDVHGVRFIKSLENHLMDRLILWSGSIILDDFYEVKSMRGVYITTTVDGGSHFSVVTFNNGASWSKLTPPANSDCSKQTGCYLHLHVLYSQAASLQLYNSSFQTGPLSSSNAKGIIIAHGSLGTSRDYDPAKAGIFISDDGGHTWNQANIPNGLYVYGIGDYGNIIAVVPDSQTAENIWFSHDRGKCFKSEPLDTTKYFSVTRGLLMDPEGASLYAFALGLEGTSTDDSWRLVAINFRSVLATPCHASDYKQVDLENCIMGYRSIYKITLPASVCYNDINFQPLVKTSRCNCTYADLECDYGYLASWSADGVLTCTNDPNFNLSDVCPPGQEYYTHTKNGVQIIPGDTCTLVPGSKIAGWLEPVQAPCTGHEEDSGYDLTSSSKALPIIGVVVFVGIVIVTALLGLYCWIKCNRDSLNATLKDRVLYKKVPITESGLSSEESDEDLLT